MAHGRELEVLRKLAREQPETLYQITLYERRYGRVPTANELAEILSVNSATATMRVKRLKDAKYLTKKRGTWVVDSSRVVTQPETAALLLEVSETYANHPGGRIPEKEMLLLMDKVGIELDDDAKKELIRMLSDAQYLAPVDGWEGCYRTGPQIANEIQFLQRLREHNSARM